MTWMIYCFFHYVYCYRSLQPTLLEIRMFYLFVPILYLNTCFHYCRSNCYTGDYYCDHLNETNGFHLHCYCHLNGRNHLVAFESDRLFVSQLVANTRNCKLIWHSVMAKVIYAAGYAVQLDVESPVLPDECPLQMTLRWNLLLLRFDLFKIKNHLKLCSIQIDWYHKVNYLC